jgi:hypothetical protein
MKAEQMGRGLLLRSVEPLASAKRRLTRPPAASLSADRLPDALNIRKKGGNCDNEVVKIRQKAVRIVTNEVGKIRKKEGSANRDE